MSHEGSRSIQISMFNCASSTLQGTNISRAKALLKMIFLFLWWDMFVSLRVADFCSKFPASNANSPKVDLSNGRFKTSVVLGI